MWLRENIGNYSFQCVNVLDSDGTSSAHLTIVPQDSTSGHTQFSQGRWLWRSTGSRTDGSAEAAHEGGMDMAESFLHWLELTSFLLIDGSCNQCTGEPDVTSEWKITGV